MQKYVVVVVVVVVVVKVPAKESYCTGCACHFVFFVTAATKSMC